MTNRQVCMQAKLELTIVRIERASATDACAFYPRNRKRYATAMMPPSTVAMPTSRPSRYAPPRLRDWKPGDREL